MGGGLELSSNKDGDMDGKVSIEVDARHEGILRRALAFAEEMEQLALQTPDGAVFDACEQAVLDKGRQFQVQLLQEAVTRRIEAAEKKGRRSASVLADTPRKTAAPKNAGS
jgi:hypothetical protein